MTDIKAQVQQAGVKITQANREEEAGRLEEALLYQRQALSIFDALLKTKHPSVLALTEYINSCIYKAVQLEEAIQARKSAPPTANNTNGPGGGANNNNSPSPANGDESVRSHEMSQAKQDLSCTQTSCMNYTWDDVTGLDEVKRRLEQIISVSVRLAHLYGGNREAEKSLLFYGPPGVGKTLLGKVLSSVTGRPFFYISSADIVSKYVGESERNVKALFEMLRAQERPILFIDEVETLCAKRGGTNNNNNSNSGGTRVLQQFLVEMEGMCDNGQLLVIGATNLPWDLDEAMRRRLALRIYIPLPDERTRCNMLRHYIQKNENSLSEAQFQDLARLTEHYSGSDISQLTKAAALQPIEMITCATHFKRIEMLDGSRRYVATSPQDPRGKPRSYKDFSPEKTKLILAPPITCLHVKMALSIHKPTVNLANLKRYTDWTQEFGFSS